MRQTRDFLIESEVVKRSNTTIGISPRSASGSLTLLVRRLFNVLVHFTMKDGDQECYSRPLQEVMRYIDYNSNDIARIKSHLETMAATPIAWNISTVDDDIWTTTNLLGHASIIKPKTRGLPSILEWSFPVPVRHQLLQPTQWTQLKLVMHTRLKSGASIALFEICARYKGVKGGKTARKPYEWWSPVLSGTRTDAITAYKYFKRDVLRPAIAEVNTHAEFTIELIEHLVGKRVAELQFKITEKEERQVINSEAPGFDGVLLERVLRVGVSQTEAQRICEKHDPTAIITAIEYTEKRALSAAGVDNKPAYFLKALAEGYREPVAVAKPQKQASLDLADPEGDAGRLRDAYKVHHMKQALRYWKELDSDAMRTEIDAFKATNPNAMVMRALNKNVLTTKLAETAFTEWLSQKLWGEPNEDDLMKFSAEKMKGTI